MRLFAVLLIAISHLLSFLTPGHFSPQGQVLTGYDLIAAVNALRSANGLKAYSIDPLLMLSAQTQADYLASQAPGPVSGHVGPGGSDADARAKAVGFPYVAGLDINENWASMQIGTSFDELFNGGWSDAAHQHTMLHQYGQLAGAGIAVSGDRMYIILNVAAYWGDSGKTPWPTSSGVGQSGTPGGVSQYIAPVKIATPLADGSVIHQVQSGQSLWSIAIKYGIKIDTIRRLNNISPDGTIQIGQKLIIRGPGLSTPTPMQMTDTPSLSDFLPPGAEAQIVSTPIFTPSSEAQVISTPVLPPRSEAQIISTPISILPASPPQLVDPTGIFLILFALCGAGLVLVSIGLRR
jgi:LysM repeat protein